METKILTRELKYLVERIEHYIDGFEGTESEFERHLRDAIGSVDKATDILIMTR